MSCAHTQYSLAHIEAVLSRVRLIPESNFTRYGGGWGDRISLALIDAVYSISAKYTATSGLGVAGRLKNLKDLWESAPGSPLYSLRELCTHDESEIRSVMGKGKVAPGKQRSRYKSIAVLDAATAFTDLGIDSADDLRSWIGGVGDLPRDKSAFAQARKAYTQVYGLGVVTFEYWLMLLGIPGVKADRRIVSFVQKVIAEGAGSNVVPPSISAKEARSLLLKAYELWKQERQQRNPDETVDLRAFDHAVWLFERSA